MQFFSFSKYTFFGIALVGTIGLVGCTKPSAVGSDLLPSSDNIKGAFVQSDARTLDTAVFRMNTVTEAEDTIVTYRSVFPEMFMYRFPFGVVNDPVFGKQYAGVFLQPSVINQTTDPNLATGILDSVILTLQYDMPVDQDGFLSTNSTDISTFKTQQIVGDTTVTQSLKVYRITEVMNNNSTYQSNKDFDKEAAFLGNISYNINPTRLQNRWNIRNWKNTADSLNGYTIPSIRIPLSASFGRTILSNASKLSLNGTLKEFLKGIYIEPGNNNTFLQRLNLRNSKLLDDKIDKAPRAIPQSGTYITTYYHAPGTPTVSQKHIIGFGGSSENVATMKYLQDRIGTPVATALQPANAKRIGDSVIYVQGMAGTNGKISFPNLSKLKGKVVINKAEITFKAISDATGFPKPDYLTLAFRATLTNVGTFFTGIPDLRLNRGTIFSYNNIPSTSYSGKLNGNIYTINVTQHLQNMIDERFTSNNNNKDLYILAFDKAHNMQRVVLGGARNRTYAPVLKVYMSYL